MIKEINVCKYCSVEIPTGDLCNKCNSIYFEARQDALNDIEKRIGTIAKYQNIAFNLIEGNDSVLFWGKDGLKLRQQILDAFKKS